MASKRIQRFDSAERMVHWMAAISFVYSALTGLSMWSHKLFWLSAVFGGGSTVRGMHPLGGTLFAFVLGVMFLRWAKLMNLDADDRTWLAQSHKYATHDTEGLPETGRFNGGQKMMFWMQSLFALLLFASGVVLWFPEWMPRALRLLAVLVHPLAAIGSIGGIIVHIYMGTAVVPGALRAMMRGWVTERWAESHHPKWYREVRKG